MFCAQAANTDTRPDNYIARARQLLRALYPGLDRRLRPVIIGDRLSDPSPRYPEIMSNFTMELHDFELGLLGEPSTACWCSEPTLRATFGFDWQTEGKERKNRGRTGTVTNYTFS
jgi:hypothetical protein